MNIFNLSGRQLVLLSALIADQIALEYNIEEQEIIAAILEAIGENLSVYIAVAAEGRSEKTEWFYCFNRYNQLNVS